MLKIKRFCENHSLPYREEAGGLVIEIHDAGLYYKLLRRLAVRRRLRVKTENPSSPKRFTAFVGVQPAKEEAHGPIKFPLSGRKKVS